MHKPKQPVDDLDTILAMPPGKGRDEALAAFPWVVDTQAYVTGPPTPAEALRQIKALRDAARAEASTPTAPSTPAHAFTFDHGEASYSGARLKLPAGFAVDVLRKLVDNLGHVVSFKSLDDSSMPREAGERLRSAVLKIRQALRRAGAPHKVHNVKGHGYKLL